MNNKELYDKVKQDFMNRHGDAEALSGIEPEDIMDFMGIAFCSASHQDRFKSFTHWLLHLGLTDNDIMWVYNNIEK